MAVFNLDRMCQTKNGKGSLRERIHFNKVYVKNIENAISSGTYYITNTLILRNMWQFLNIDKFCNTEWKKEALMKQLSTIKYVKNCLNVIILNVFWRDVKKFVRVKE